MLIIYERGTCLCIWLYYIGNFYLKNPCIYKRCLISNVRRIIGFFGEIYDN